MYKLIEEKAKCLEDNNKSYFEFDSVKMGRGDGASEKEVEITNKIKASKYSKKFAEDCVKQAKKEKWNGKSANGVTITNDYRKCFAEFGMHGINASNDYLTGYIGDKAEIPIPPDSQLLPYYCNDSKKCDNQCYGSNPNPNCNQNYCNYTNTKNRVINLIREWLRQIYD